MAATNVIHVKVTPEGWAKIDRDASEMGLQRSAYIRYALGVEDPPIRGGARPGAGRKVQPKE